MTVINPERVESVARGLAGLDRERITGWQGPEGAAFNVISEDLHEAGLLNADWSLSPFGLAVRDYLRTYSANEESDDGR